MSKRPGAFTPAAREVIYAASGHRCAGCGRTDLTTQHRRGRRMGGTRDPAIGHPTNGVALCGSGTWGCHGWTEANPRYAALLGWRLLPGEDPIGSPWWNRYWAGWVAWVLHDGHPFIEQRFADLGDLDQPDARADAVTQLQLARPSGPPISIKATR